MGYYAVEFLTWKRLVLALAEAILAPRSLGKSLPVEGQHSCRLPTLPQSPHSLLSTAPTLRITISSPQFQWKRHALPEVMLLPMTQVSPASRLPMLSQCPPAIRNAGRLVVPALPPGSQCLPSLPQTAFPSSSPYPSPQHQWRHSAGPEDIQATRTAGSPPAPALPPLSAHTADPPIAPTLYHHIPASNSCSGPPRWTRGHTSCQNSNF